MSDEITGSLTARLEKAKKVIDDAIKALNDSYAYTAQLEQENENLRQAIARKP